ncbi:unnamed protein product, partial [Mesocestoides corti]|uniref:Ileal sodium/bile acid cotransporter n=1 Tax=Mesocestoides corti TaxID=53468 RepID=A0A0R3UAS1_MESCO
MCRCHLLLVILLLLLLPNSTVFAFYSSDVKESIGGLITDAQVCEERRRIDKETIPQIKNELTVSNYSTLRIACPTANLTFTQNTTGYQSLVCNLTYQTDTPLAVSFDTDVHQIASLAEPFWIYLAPGSSVMTLTMPIRRTQMGSTYLKIWVRQAKPGRQSESLHTWDRYNATLVAQYTDWLVNGTAAYEAGSPSVMGFHLKVLRARGLLEVIFRIVVAVLVCGLTLLMGCELDALLIWRHLKKPVAPLIGFLCQFGLMPTIAFGIASVVPIKAEFGFGLLTTGCCPGGGGSNIWTLLLHGDLNLSMTMTFVSSVFALGMMPLMIFIYGRFFIDGGAIKIPYLEIAGQLCYIVVPVLIGMFIKWKWRACGTRAARLLQPLAFAFLVTIIGFGTYVNLPIYRLMGE